MADLEDDVNGIVFSYNLFGNCGEDCLACDAKNSSGVTVTP